MRILVMFDLPTGSASERKSYTGFRNFLINDGYIMEQYSVYSRVTLGRDNMKTHMDRLETNLPEAGSITVFQLTETQYEDRLILLGKPVSKSSNIDLGAQLTLVF